MRLSRLNIAGFKSFPDRAELGFDMGVTAIVGPNGCGKSNVVDAITWVLGEQSAKSLRGERMEDIIFSGSDARKPTAAAEVRLKLSDVTQAAMAAVELEVDPLLDGQPIVARDVEIGRRLYRSGESEYLIDGQACRLRDIHDLLMDSGLGVKAYAVIEQGKIGQILASRPTDRRALIEEAAGVTKYKARRRSAELKLEAAAQNLTRIDDIVYEVEKQRGALKRQAARARRYRRLREELRRWEQVQFARRHEALADAIEAADARLAEARVREGGAAARVAELETALERLRLGLAEAEVATTAARERAHEREMQIGRREQQVQFERQQIDELARQAASFGAEVTDLEGRRDPAALAIQAQLQAADEARAALQTSEQRVTACEADHREAMAAVQAIDQDVESTRAKVFGISTTLSALRQARDNAAAVRDRVAIDRERLDLEQRELEAERSSQAAAQATATSDLTAAKAALEEAQSRHALQAASLELRRAERQRLGQAQTTRHRDLAATEARLHSLEEVDASRASFGDAPRYLLAEGDETIAGHGALADHLEVDRDYARAVDALLGDLLQHLVVARAEDVETALDRLDADQTGRCGFVVLEAAAALAPRADTVPVPSGARALGSVVRATGPFAAVLERVLDPALIVDSFDEARRVASIVDVPVAAMTGEVLRGGWLVQGGARADNRGILESRGQMAALRESVLSLQAEVDRLTRELDAQDRVLPGAEQELVGLAADLHEREKRIVGLEAIATRAAEAIERLDRRLGVVLTEQRRTVEEDQATSLRRDEATTAIAEHELRLRDAESALTGVLAELQAAREAADGRMRLVADAKAAQAALGERATALASASLQLEEAARDLEARIAGRQAEIARTETRRDELRASIAETERLLDQDVRALDDLRLQVRQLDEQLAELRAQFGEHEVHIKTARQQLEAVRADVMHSEVTRATAASELVHLAEACQETVGNPIDDVVREVARMEEAGELTAPARRIADAAEVDADELDDDDDDGVAPEAEAGVPAVESEARDDVVPRDQALMTPDEVITDLKQKVERLGPVNMMAIEQFDELEERHTFLTTQRQDLLDSISQTGEAIRKIDKTTRERFAEAFTSINAHFQTTFTTLFGGGRAGLVLIDQENDADSGIDIIAQPPGKRLQNVQLLSGGEKALTAMALMFAIFKHRPSPFCLLDEIDAPLDDANIGRFVEMLQGMQDHTQFILITHNRKTMEIADRLYGVTMEEPGVSKLISLQLN